MKASNVTLLRNARVWTMAAEAPWDAPQECVVVMAGGLIDWLGPLAHLPAAKTAAIEHEFDLGGRAVTPGLIDCHTHLIYAGTRAAEFERRLQGETYESIAQSGGGIRATVAATRQATAASLLADAMRRAQALMNEGVTTVEIKSGYGLEEATERRMLATARTLGQTLPITVKTTALAAHAVPAEYESADAYIDAVIGWLGPWIDDGLVDAVDVFCERIGFSARQTQRVFEAALARGCPVKLHAEQLSWQGGCELASAYGALSCDHLEHLSEAGVHAMASAGTVAVLLPGAYYYLRETQRPPVDLLRRAKVPIAIATDHNPGSSPTLSPLLMLNMAATFFHLTPAEALAGLTCHAATALGLRDRGVIAEGRRADLCVWDVDHPRELTYAFGVNPLHRRVFAGQMP
jgi:imidazolonepropionase